jgi:hypothetical protein
MKCLNLDFFFALLSLVVKEATRGLNNYVKICFKVSSMRLWDKRLQSLFNFVGFLEKSKG